MSYIHPLPWPEWERFALLDVVTVVGVIAFVWIAVNRLPDAHRPRGGAAQRRSPMAPHSRPPPRISSKCPPPSLFRLAWRQRRVRLLGLMVAAGALFALLRATANR